MTAEHIRVTHLNDRDTYPRTDGLSGVIGVTFIGAQQQFEALIPTRFPNVKEIHIRPPVVLQWLRTLHAVNPFYSSIYIDDSIAMFSTLDRLPDDLIKEATVISDQIGLTVDRLATNDGVDEPVSNKTDTLADDGESTNDGDEGDLPCVFLTRSNPVSLDPNHAAKTTLKSLILALEAGEANANNATERHGDSDDHDIAEEDDPRRTDASSVTNNSSSGDTQPTQCPPLAPLSIPMNDVPVNEFESNDRLLYCAFPFRFLLGKGLTGRGSVSTLATRHMLMQFTTNFFVHSDRWS